MRRGLYFVLLLFLVSCNYFLSKEEKTKRLVNQKLLAIDWEDVDHYPLFEDCDEMVGKAEQKACFQQTMLAYFANVFEGLSYEVEREITDTIHIDLLIDEHGFITLTDIRQGTSVQQELPNIGEELRERLKELTTVAPALKQGVPVSVSVRLPLVLNTKN
ncbi:MAG: hypothetical protein AAF634_07655 [Bacteroidota bacterium]